MQLIIQVGKTQDKHKIDKKIVTHKKVIQQIRL